MTLPNGRPREMTSASLMSLGSFRTCITLDGAAGLLISPLNFLLSLPLATLRADDQDGLLGQN